MLRILIIDGAAELHLDRHDATVISLDDRIDLMVTVLSSQVCDPGFCSLRVDPQRLDDQRLEELS